MYDTVEDLLREIEADEDSFIEFKEVVFKGNQVRFARDAGKASTVIAEVFTSMANTSGGVVVFGVNKRREIVGIDPERRGLLEQFVVNCALNNCVPPLEPILDWVLLPDREGTARLCLKVDIEKSVFALHRTIDGHYYKRVGSHRHRLVDDELARRLTRAGLSIPFEEWPVPRAGIDALNRLRFESYYQSTYELRVEDSGLPYERLLANLKLLTQVEGGPWQPTNIGILLFSDQPERFLDGAYVDIAVYDHPEADGNTVDTKRITGPIPEQITAVTRYLLTSPYVPTESRKDGYGREDQPRYSERALQEAIVNALAHRDYQLTGSQVIVTVFPDRIEIKNPGGLHNTLTPDNLFSGCQPIRRNQLLTGFLRSYRSAVTNRAFMEQRGEGFLTLVRESERIAGRRPELEATPQSVRLTIFGRAGTFPSN